MRSGIKFGLVLLVLILIGASGIKVAGQDERTFKVVQPSREPMPSLVIGRQFGKIGVGYVALDAKGQTQFYTVFHAVSGNQPVFGNVVNGVKATLSECQLMFNPEVVSNPDGSCLVHIPTQIRPNMIRAPQYTEEVVVWSFELNLWMPFTVIDRTDDRWIIRADLINLNEDDWPDTTGLVCGGYSGSPVVLAIDGHPVLTSDGYLISVGELFGIIYAWNVGGQQCSNVAGVFTFGFE